MTVHVNTSRHAEDLADGRVVAPGETVKDLDVSEEHNKRLIDEGLFLERGDPKPLESLNKTELTQLAESASLEVPSGATKEDIITLLREQADYPEENA